jgi:hypothetical protein
MSVPFKMDAYEGLAETEGVVHLEPDALVLEFQTRDGIFGVVKTDVKEIRISIEDLVSVEVRKHVFSTKLKICTRSMKALADCPGNRAGEAELGIKRKHREAAEELAMDASIRIGELRMDAAMRGLDEAGDTT